ncbi:TonB-dependent receptor [Cesiribacter sp. SM1]|uniref:SusC/RagA family TonB-linked outer membrane protein n=1 Tax=Cesiribacter sp. SM1 TaxID=2861196 RepID=UPI001CD400C1|nr:TonB-dependent receptor [Cesiribacter sp. SM1]
MKSKILHKCKEIYLFLILMFMAVFAQAQAKKVTGVVTDKVNGGSLPGVSVTIQNSSLGTVTDINGQYSIEAAPDDVLIFSFIGYEKSSVKVGNSTQIDIALQEDIESLEEVVVVGYGTTKKSDVSGSVSSVEAEKLTAFPALSAVQTLQGRAAGVQIQSNNGGQPGADYSIQIRGGTSINASSRPLQVVDGFVGGEMPPPEDIASIEILKDASATAIYGSRGANGVILVTTKRGKAGEMRIELNSSYAVQEVLNRLDLLDANEFTEYIQEINPGYENFGANTDWQDVIFRQGYISNNQLSVSGGSDQLRYYVSGTYFDQKGIVLGSEYNRFTLSSNLDIKPKQFLNLGLNLYARRSTNNGINTQESSGGSGSAGIISSAFRFNPDIGIYNENGDLTISEVGDDIDNPYALGTEYVRERVTDRFQANTYGELTFTDWLSFKTTLGMTFNNWRDGEFRPTTLLGGAGRGGVAELEAMKQSSLLNENYITINKSFSDHQTSLVAGYSFQQYRNESWAAGGSGFITNSSSFWALQQGAVPTTPESGLSESSIKSYYGRLNYSYQSKYILTFTGRYDGASNFSKNNKWAFFPSGALAWDMTAEPFLQDVNFLSRWKWRVSYGVVGNQAIGPYQSLARFSSIYGSRNGQLVNAIKVDNLANDNLSWETTRQFNVGADIGLFKGRINLTADYYDMETTDLLFARELPAYTGVRFQYQNIGAVGNKGFEFAISSRNLVNQLKWTTDFNISFNRNTVLELPDNGADIFYANAPGHLGLGSDNQVIRVGEPLGVFYGFVYDGVYQSGEEILEGSGFESEAGGERFVDLNGDGKLTFDGDRQIIGNPNPDFIWSLNNSFNYKGFDLNVFVQASEGNDMLSYTLLELNNLSGSNNATAEALNRWSADNTNTDIPKASRSRARKISTRYIYDGSYIRLKNIALGYVLPRSLVESIKLSNVRISVSAQNLFTITDYPGLDPEVGYGNANGNAAGNLYKGLDYGSYPNVKSYTLGVNISL